MYNAVKVPYGSKILLYEKINGHTANNVTSKYVYLLSRLLIYKPLQQLVANGENWRSYTDTWEEVGNSRNV